MVYYMYVYYGFIRYDFGNFNSIVYFFFNTIIKQSNAVKLFSSNRACFLGKASGPTRILYTSIESSIYLSVMFINKI